MAIMAGLVGGEKAPAAPTKNETTVQVGGWAGGWEEKKWEGVRRRSERV